jgi:hypothetical protein
MNFHFRPQSYGHIPKAIADDRKWNERSNGPMNAFLQSASEGPGSKRIIKRWCPKPARSFVVSVNCVTNEKRNPCVHYVSQPWRSLPPARVRAADWLPSSCESLAGRTAQRSTNAKKRKIHYDIFASQALMCFQARDLGERFLRLPEFRIRPVIFEDGEHPCCQVIQNMAVKRPQARVICIEAYLDR